MKHSLDDDDSSSITSDYTCTLNEKSELKPIDNKEYLHDHNHSPDYNNDSIDTHNHNDYGSNSKYKHEYMNNIKYNQSYESKTHNGDIEFTLKNLKQTFRITSSRFFSTERKLSPYAITKQLSETHRKNTECRSRNSSLLKLYSNKPPSTTATTTTESTMHATYRDKNDCINKLGHYENSYSPSIPDRQFKPKHNSDIQSSLMAWPNRTLSLRDEPNHNHSRIKTHSFVLGITGQDLVIQPSFMQNAGSMCVTELWKEKDKRKLVMKAQKKPLNLSRLHISKVKKDDDNPYKADKATNSRSLHNIKLLDAKSRIKALANRSNMVYLRPVESRGPPRIIENSRPKPERKYISYTSHSPFYKDSISKLRNSKYAENLLDFNLHLYEPSCPEKELAPYGQCNSFLNHGEANPLMLNNLEYDFNLQSPENLPNEKHNNNLNLISLMTKIDFDEKFYQSKAKSINRSFSNEDKAIQQIHVEKNKEKAKHAQFINTSMTKLRKIASVCQTVSHDAVILEKYPFS